MNIEKVKWIDSCQSMGWNDMNDGIIEPAICYSIGFILKETDSFIIISGHYSPKSLSTGSIESCCGAMAIPKCSILERNVLCEECS